MNYELESAMEDVSAYLDGAAKTLRIMTEELECEMLAIEKYDAGPVPKWILERCCGFSVIVRELDRITDDLNAAITKEYQKKTGAEDSDKG